MVLAMSRPWKHPTTGVYYYRKVVPERLRQAVGVREIKRSLQTRDPVEARQRFQAVAVEAQQLLDEAEAKPLVSKPELQSLSQKQAHALAGEIYREIVSEHQDNPGRSGHWKAALFAMQHTLPVSKREPGAPMPRKMFGFGPESMAVRQLGPQIDVFLERRGIHLDDRSRQTLAGAAAPAIADARRLLLRMAEGDYSPDPNATRFPAYEDSSVSPQGSYELEEFLQRWRLMSKPAPKTFKRWSGIMRAMFTFLKKTDVFTIAEEDVQKWCDHRVEAGIARTTIANADLAGPRTIFNWACADKKVKLPSNPAQNVRLKVGKQVVLRQRGYRPKEAEKILTATIGPMSKRLTTTTAAARRWVPWLCAYSGARVGEIAQLREQDIYLEEGIADIWIMRITPEAGSQKTSTAREVPLHSHVLDQGFLKYVATRKGKPLFYEPTRQRGADEANRQSDKVGERLALWIRELGIADKSIAPNHAWRHRFRTVGRTFRVEDSMLNALDGHVAASIADTYGDYELLAKKWVIERFPRYSVAGDPTGCRKTPAFAINLSQLHPALERLVASADVEDNAP